MNYVEALALPEGLPHPWVFMAGGITGCPDWQSELVDLLRDTTGTLLNPRRKNFPINDPNASEAQILWEHRMLRAADAISFWFPKDTLCPIVLYELGAWSMTGKPLFIAAESGYQRQLDVQIQTRFVRPDLMVSDSLGVLAAQVRNWALAYAGGGH